jgi:hypothetical protein
MPFPRLTWAGLLVATLGWGFLLSYPLLAPHTGATGGNDPARFILIFGENAIITGFALAILGGLEKGLMLLMRLTGTAVPVMSKPRNNGMMQQQQPQMQQQGMQQPQMQQQGMPQGMQQPMQHHMPQVHLSQMQMPPLSQMQQAAAQSMAAGGPHLMSQRAPNEVVTRGALNGRDYVLFRDGSVLVETLLGPRRFSSISEAQEFIGTN